MGLLFFSSSMSMFIAGLKALKIKNNISFSSKYISVIFQIAAISLFAGKGKTPLVGYLSFAWWVALIALVISVISAIALTILSFYITPAPAKIQNKM
jgi:hypothetical protein